MNYYHDFDYSAAPGIETFGTVFGAIFGFIVVFYLLILAFGVVSYVLQSLGMYTIAKRRDIKNAWLAWLPVGNMWILGSISDQYQYVAKGRVRNRRKVLMALTAAMLLCSFLMTTGGLVAAFTEAAGMDAGEVLFGATLGVLLIAYLILAVIAIVAIVIEYMALYDLYRSCDPGNGVLYLILSILFGCLLPLFVFVCRKKDLGMPPRKTKEPVVPVELPISEAPVEDAPFVEEPTEE
jgi:hypothetical protein